MAEVSFGDPGYLYASKMFIQTALRYPPTKHIVALLHFVGHHKLHLVVGVDFRDNPPLDHVLHFWQPLLFHVFQELALLCVLVVAGSC